MLKLMSDHIILDPEQKARFHIDDLLKIFQMSYLQKGHKEMNKVIWDTKKW